MKISLGLIFQWFVASWSWIQCPKPSARVPEFPEWAQGPANWPRALTRFVAKTRRNKAITTQRAQ